ncbi:hypothetical protein ACFXMV_11340 [Rhodococcus sp. NPDC059179]|uniref:hypothetical protein n=1 Tax=Rhodococcus sp. NPDC059179 TaxID=3346760 RepID=UPI00366B51BC
MTVDECAVHEQQRAAGRGAELAQVHGARGGLDPAFYFQGGAALRHVGLLY